MAAFTRRQYKGASVSTTTTNSLNTTDTSVTIAANTGWPSSAGVPFYVVIDPGTSAEEKCSATISGTTLTLTRAQDDTTASSHASGATIYPVFTAKDANEANEVASKLTTKGDLLVTDGSALNRLAVGTNDYSLLADSAATNGVSWKQIPAAGLASDAVTTAKILDSNVTAAKLATDSVTTAKIVDANVTGAKLANLTVSTKTASYTLVAGDRNTRVVMNSASATTITVNNSVFAAGDAVWIHNIGAGVCTITAGTATVTVSGSLALSQWAGGVLYFTSASAAIYFPNTDSSTGGMVYVTGGSFTTASAVTVDNCFTSTYRNYLIRVEGLSSAASPEIRFYYRTSSSNNTNSSYSAGIVYGVANSNIAGQYVSSTYNSSAYGGSDRFGISFTILAPQVAVATTHTSVFFGKSGAAAQYGSGGGIFNNTTQFDGIEIYPSTGTITGTYRIYGMVDA